MNPKFIKGLIIFGLAGAAIGLAAYFARQYKLLENACYSIVGGVIHNFGISNVSMTLFFKVVNEIRYMAPDIKCIITLASYHSHFYLLRAAILFLRRQ